ncbi:MAG: hypothetical protein ABIX01_17700 [Chitinophagaceae bacterium]
MKQDPRTASIVFVFAGSGLSKMLDAVSLYYAVASPIGFQYLNIG